MNPNPFYLTRPLRAAALSSPVGSGKSYAAARYLAQPDQANRNFIYVAPTILLVEQVRADLQRAARDADAFTRNVALIHSENRRDRMEDSDGDIEAAASTRADALRTINGAEEDEGLVVVLTTGTLLAIMANIQHPERFGLILDEAFKPIKVDSFPLGEDPRDSYAYFRELFDIDAEQGHRIVPAQGKQAAVEDIAAGRFGKVGGKFKSLQPVAELVRNSATRCELVLSEPIKALLRGETPTPKKSRGKNKDEDAKVVLHYAGYVSPEPFASFREVLFLSALFEQSVLHALWTRALGVTFTEHPCFPRELQRDVHAEQGRFLAVGHLLHADDNASLENLSRNQRTGERGETRQGHRVLDQLVQTAAAHFGATKFLLQTNAKKGYGRGDPLPSNATWIPAFAYGLNAYQDVDNVAALCVVNPTPVEWAWVKERTGMKDHEIARAYRIPATYQALGRCSIRRREATTDPKTLLCVGKAEADFILKLFPGSLSLGQVGDLPSLRQLGTGSKPRRGKVDALADLVIEELGQLEDSVESVASRTLRAALKSRRSLQDSKEGNPGIGSLLEAHPDTWRLAVAAACSRAIGWDRQGHRLVRRTWATYRPESDEPATESAEACIAA